MTDFEGQLRRHLSAAVEKAPRFDLSAVGASQRAQRRRSTWVVGVVTAAAVAIVVGLLIPRLIHGHGSAGASSCAGQLVLNGTRYGSVGE